MYFCAAMIPVCSEVDAVYVCMYVLLSAVECRLGLEIHSRPI